MTIKLRLFFICCLLFTVVWICPTTLHGAAERVVIQREEIIPTVKRNITITERLRKGMGSKAQTEMLSELRHEAEQQIKDLFPRSLEGGSRRSVEKAVQIDILIRNQNMDYNKLLVKKRVMDVLAQLKYQAKVPSLSKRHSQSIKNRVKQFMKGIRRSMVHHLEKQFSAKVIRAHVEAMKQNLLSQVPDTNTYALKRPISSAKVRGLVSEFDSRLSKTKGRVTSRLSSSPKSIVEQRKHVLLHEITAPAVRLLLKKTIDPERKSISAESLVPGYNDVVRRLDMKGKSLARSNTNEANGISSSERRNPNESPKPSKKANSGRPEPESGNDTINERENNANGGENREQKEDYGLSLLVILGGSVGFAVGACVILLIWKYRSAGKRKVDRVGP